MKEIKKNAKSDDDITTVSVEKEFGMLYVMPDNAQHIGEREEQQDYFSYNDLFDFEQIQKYGCVAVMADGMGGMKNGREAAICGVNEFLQAYQNEMDKESDILNALARALVTANDTVCEYEGAGATLIAAVVKDNSLHWISVGDSHIYLFRNGLARKLNTEHIYAKELDKLAEKGEISTQDAINHPERKALTSYLGLPEITEADYNKHSYPLRAGDIILLCSDGLYGTISDTEISDILATEKEDTAEKLIETVLLRQKPQQDNVTTVLLKII